LGIVLPINIHTKALIHFPLDNHESTAGQPLQVSLSLSLRERERERERAITIIGPSQMMPFPKREGWVLHFPSVTPMKEPLALQRCKRQSSNHALKKVKL
jgi:hypothetical protein